MAGFRVRSIRTEVSEEFEENDEKIEEDKENEENEENDEKIEEDKENIEKNTKKEFPEISIEIPKDRVLFDQNINCYVFLCPHCEIFVEVEKNAINCGIFRHGYFFEQSGNNIVLTGQIGPHSTFEECQRLLTENKIVGCANPFRLLQNSDGIYIVEKCGFNT